MELKFMIEVTINGEKKISLKETNEGLSINDLQINHELIKISNSSYKVIHKNKIYNVEIIANDGKLITLRINNQELTLKVADHIDQILEKLGMDTIQSVMIKEIKAPMPGSILGILVEEGSEVKEGDQLLVLEAMKMENVIKSPGSGVISKILIGERDNVEKNQVLISFE